MALFESEEFDCVYDGIARDMEGKSENKEKYGNSMDKIEFKRPNTGREDWARC